MKKTLKPIIFILICLFFLAGSDQHLQITQYDYSDNRVPASFESFTIVQLSDLHMKNFGKHQSLLLDAILSCSPDLIVLTGDIADEKHDDMTPLCDLLNGLSDIPVYYVSGNHELKQEASVQYEEMLEIFSQFGVKNLDDSQATITKNKSSIQISGLQWRSQNPARFLKTPEDKLFHILLYHGADAFPQLASKGYDLILSGHIHGGIVRLPFIGGIFSNKGTLFPDYDAGAYQLGSSTLISSRGLGDAFLPRFFNRPEVVSITLHHS